jgi:hypothetical protein
MTLFENLTVDDASSDQTGSRTGQLSPQEQRVRRGPQADILGISRGCCTAVEKAHGDWLLLPPAELTIDDAYINLFMETARQADVVVGSRSKREEHSFFLQAAIMCQYPSDSFPLYDGGTPIPVNPHGTAGCIAPDGDRILVQRILRGGSIDQVQGTG